MTYHSRIDDRGQPVPLCDADEDVTDYWREIDGMDESEDTVTALFSTDGDVGGSPYARGHGETGWHSYTATSHHLIGLTVEDGDTYLFLTRGEAIAALGKDFIAGLENSADENANY